MSRHHLLGHGSAGQELRRESGRHTMRLRHDLVRVTGSWHRCLRCSWEGFGPLEYLKREYQRCPRAVDVTLEELKKF